MISAQPLLALQTNSAAIASWTQKHLEALRIRETFYKNARAEQNSEMVQDAYPLAAVCDICVLDDVIMDVHAFHVCAVPVGARCTGERETERTDTGA